MSAGNWQSLSHVAAKHPLIFGFLVLLFVVTIALGVLHEMRLAGEIAIVVVRHTKHEVAQLADVWKRLKREATTGREGEQKESGSHAREQLAARRTTR